MPTFVANRQRYQAEGSAAVLNFTRRLNANLGTFALSGGSTAYPRGYHLSASTAGYGFNPPEAYPQASLRFSLSAGGFTCTRQTATFFRGYIIDPAAGGLTTAWIGAGITLQARVAANTAPFTAGTPATPLNRALILPLSQGALTWTTLASGFQFQPPAPAAGQRRPKSGNPYGGSDDTGGSFIRPQYVKYNSALKAKNFGLVSNLLSFVEGELGGQTGSNTAFFVVETDGPVQIYIKNNATSAFTRHYISVGVLDSDRKPLALTPEGFAYRNDNHATQANESAESLPAGIYYFTITSNQWQAIPFNVTLQVIRYKPLIGKAGGTLATYGRFAIAKLYGAATLSGPMSGVITPDSKIDGLLGAVTVASAPTLSLVIMRGSASGTMVPYGRLKQTHRITGTITAINSNVATLTSSPPYGGGYGGGY